jgi:topoisomerase-4 subunit A
VGAKVLPPLVVKQPETDLVLCISNEGRMLVFPVADLPKLSKGKGNKLMSIPSARAASREEYVCQLAIVPADGSVTLVAGKRKLGLKADDLAHYHGERGRRGNKLPRGLQRIDEVLVNPGADISSDQTSSTD